MVGADLSQADLLGAQLDWADLRDAKFDLNFEKCWKFEGAKFSRSQLPWLKLHPQWEKFKDTVQIAG
jgi:uncharacterized protein YjbI with pentapeptide repeats